MGSVDNNNNKKFDITALVQPSYFWGEEIEAQLTWFFA